MFEKQIKSVKDRSNSKKIDVKSQQINDEIQKKIFKKIFGLLDTQKCNKIDGNSIDITILPEKIKKIIEPLLQELKDQNESLTGEEFVMACEHLLKVKFRN